MNKSYWDQMTSPAIGGGITGLCAAFFLKQAEKRNVFWSKNRIALGGAYVTTAHLS
jgi:protoporphyrinogen oxidase